MNLSGFLDTLQLFVTEYNYVSYKWGCLLFDPSFINSVMLGLAGNSGELQLLVVVQFLYN